jgi:RNA polymerase sigma-70 factor (ECF subfamily)
LSPSAGSRPLDPPGRVPVLLDHLFRRESGRLVAGLVRAFGADRLELAEDVVQEALLRALRTWPYRGVPDDPRAWLLAVARNAALDRLRREVRYRDRVEAALRREAEPVLPGPLPMGSVGPDDLDALSEDQLRLLFLCCHPSLPRDSQVALALKTVVGLGTREIAAGFLARESTVAQRLVRAKRLLRENRPDFELPPERELPARLDAVLEVIYLAFTAGYSARAGESLVRRDLCHEAIRLARELARVPVTDRPAVHALAALLCFQGSRLPAREPSAEEAGEGRRGEVVLLADQDRSLWDRSLIGLGFAHLARSTEGDEETAYHLQAAIAAHHAAAPSAEATDWPGIVALYDRLAARDRSPVVALNRAVAIARAEGAAAGLRELDGLERDDRQGGELDRYHLFHAARGRLLEELGRPEEAAAAYRRALECPASGPDRRFVESRLSEG